MWSRKDLPKTETRVIDDRIFSVGLTELYRAEMKKIEVERMLPLARKLCSELHVQPLDVPIEGYYYERPELTEYFRLVRGLQRCEVSSAFLSDASEALGQFLKVYASPAIGRVGDRGKFLLPSMTSPLDQVIAMDHESDLKAISERARREVRSDDASLVAVACVTGDPLAICVARESVALYMRMVSGLQPPKIVYEWKISHVVREIAERFLAAFREATGISLPAITVDSAPDYWRAAHNAELDGRCIALKTSPERRVYHWYIDGRLEGGEVRDFWSPELWTTKRMKETPRDQRPRASSEQHSVLTP